MGKAELMGPIPPLRVSVEFQGKASPDPQRGDEATQCWMPWTMAPGAMKPCLESREDVSAKGRYRSIQTTQRRGRSHELQTQRDVSLDG